MVAPDPTEGRRSGEVPTRLETRGLRVDFGRKLALDDVSLAVRVGEIIALLGDSGCGKSTLLRAVAGLEQPSGGLVLLDGQIMGRRVPPEERGVGLMFQDYALFPHLTVMQNVRFGLHRLRADEADAVARARLEQVGLADRAASYPGDLSGGESQRVALARALAPGPRVLLLDEPFSNLDRRNRDRVRADTISVLRATGATALLVTHDPEEALLVSDRIVLMRSGRIVQIGTGADLYRRPVSHFAASFFGDLIAFPHALHRRRGNDAARHVSGAGNRQRLKGGRLRQARGDSAIRRGNRSSGAGHPPALPRTRRGIDPGGGGVLRHVPPYRRGRDIGGGGRLRRPQAR